MDLNIRDVPAEIMRSLRVDAAAEGISIKELCLRRLVPDGGASWRPQTVAGEPIKEPEKKPSKPAKVKPTEPGPVTEAFNLAASGMVEELRCPGAVESKPARIVDRSAACKCGGTGVTLVGGKRKCASCGRDLGA